MTKRLLLACLSFCCNWTTAQTDVVAFTINGVPTYKQDLQKAFREYKNTYNPDIKIKEFTKAEIDQKIKIAEARKLRIDTTYTYKGDYATILSQLQKRYLKNEILDNMDEAKETLLKRFDTELEVNQAFIPFSTTQILPKDTLIYYQKAIDARKYALVHGFAKFEQDNPIKSFGIKLNPEKENGYVGWISPLMFPDNLERILYELPEGEVSMPVRGTEGYHVFQVVGKRPIQGNPVVEAVLFNFPVVPAPASVVDSVYLVAKATYDEIETKGNFQQICQEFITAMKTNQKDCLLGEIRIQEQIPYPIIKAAFELKEIGEVSKPILGDFGYYILKLKDKRPPKSKKEIEDIVNKFIQSSYFKALNYKKQRKQLIDSFDIKLNPRVHELILDLASKYSPTDSLFAAGIPDNEEPFLIVRDTISFHTKNFKDYLNMVKVMYEAPKADADPLNNRIESIVKYSLSTDIIEDILNSYMLAAIEQVQKEDLFNNNEEYRNTILRFENELLYTNLLNELIWKKAGKDSEGLSKYFDEHRNAYSLDKERFKGWLVCANEEAVLEKIEKDYSTNPDNAKQILKSYKENHKLEITSGSWQKGDDANIDYLIFAKNSKKPKNRYAHCVALGEIIDTPKDYLDVYFEVEKDYQTYLENEMDARLKNEYKVEIFNKVIESIE